MEIQIVEMAERKCKFILKNSSPAMANALRRTMLTDIPKMAIDKVEFHLGPIDVDGREFESMTPLFDEIIAHRLGMVPVPTTDAFNFRDECVCGGEGCPSCEIMYSLNKNGPCTVLSGDLQPLGSQDLKVKDEDIPIVDLADGQSILIYAHAVMGTARKHVKWQVANGVGYSYRPIIKIDGDVESPEDVAKMCPKKVFDVVDGKLVVARSDDCSLCMTCVENFNGEGPISVVGDDTNFVFKFETDGSLTAQQVLDKATEILKKESEEFKSQVLSL